MKLIKDIHYFECNKIIGKYDSETNEILEMTDKYNICDMCGIEICGQCTKVYHFDFTIESECQDDKVILRETQCCSKCLESE